MATELIKHSPKRFTMECSECESQFNYSLSDCTRIGYNFYVKCPWCNASLSHFYRIKEIPKYDVQQSRIEMLKDFAEAIKKEFPNVSDVYTGYMLRRVISQKCSEFIKDIKNEKNM